MPLVLFLIYLAGTLVGAYLYGRLDLQDEDDRVAAGAAILFWPIAIPVGCVGWVVYKVVTNTVKAGERHAEKRRIKAEQKVAQKFEG